MAWIFRVGDTQRAKQVTVVALLVLFAGVYGGWNRRNFMPSDLTDQLAITLAALAGLCAQVALLLDRNPNARFNQYRPLRRLFFVLIVSIAFSFAGWLAFGWGVPALITQIWGKSLQVEARVHTVFPNRTGRGCHHRLEVSSPGLRETARPCVSEQIWRQTKVGDAVWLHLRSSGLGVQVDDIGVRRGD